VYACREADILLQWFGSHHMKGCHAVRRSTRWFWVLTAQLLLPVAALGALLISGAAL